LSSDELSPRDDGGGGRRTPVNESRLFVDHPALGLTLGYLLLSLLGLSFQWTLFRQFDVNFFLFAEVTDFLMGAFREPITFALSLSALAVAWFVSYYNRWEAGWWRRHPPTNAVTRAYQRFTTSSFNRFAPAIFFVGYSVMFIYIYAGHRADEVHAGLGRQVVIEVAEGQTARPARSAPTLLIGTSSRYVFAYRPLEGITEVIPHENIARIVFRQLAEPDSNTRGDPP